jgi:hypothetical protein
MDNNVLPFYPHKKNIGQKNFIGQQKNRGNLDNKIVLAISDILQKSDKSYNYKNSLTPKQITGFINRFQDDESAKSWIRKNSRPNAKSTFGGKRTKRRRYIKRRSRTGKRNHPL